MLVTRPQAQADQFCQLIDSAGGESVRCPVMNILPLPLPVWPLANAGAPVDLLIFVSANAVRHGWPQCIALGIDGRAVSKICAVGPATKAALHAMGVDAVAMPVAQFSSQGLLAMPELQALSGCRIAVFCGSRGSDVLAAALESRGAEVRLCRVYERRLNLLDVTPIVARWQNGGITIVTLTSSEIATGLRRLLGKAYARTAAQTPTVVASERVASTYRELGFQSKCIVANSALDQAMFTAVVQLADSTGC